MKDERKSCDMCMGTGYHDGGLVEQEQGMDDFLSQDDEQAAFPESELDNTSEPEDKLSDEDNKKQRVEKIMKSRRMGSLKGRAGKEDKN